MALFSRLGRRDDEFGPSDEPGEGKRTIYRTRSLAAFQVKKSIGWKIRDAVGYLETTLGPYLKKVFPNFIAVHYGYIMGMAILGSILMYPVKNARYIDILFFASCASTQAGLNTTNVNDLTLYQQIVIYILTTLTTPIFIHGSLAFLRLYWFERHFDDIRMKSKLNFKMRRTATLAARTQSMERQRTMESQRSRRRAQEQLNPGSRQATAGDPAMPDMTVQGSEPSPDSKTSNESTTSSDVSLPPQKAPADYTQSKADLYNAADDGVQHLSEPSSEDDDDVALPPQNRTIKFASDENDNTHDTPEPDKSSTKLQFANLPKPPRDDFDPKDVYMSLAMMRDKRANQQQDSTENEGPALVVHGPAERDSASRRNSSLQFELAKPRKKKPLHTRKRSGLRRSFLLSRHSFAEREEEGDDADEMIDEQDENGHENSEDEENELERAQSHLQLPSSDQSGVKYHKRSNTLDVPTKRAIGFRKSPTFEKLVKNKLKKPKVLRRRPSSIAVDDESEYDPTDSDDESSDDNSLRRQMSTQYLSWSPTVGRNSAFVNLSDQQKEELGGVEYRAIKLLTRIVLFYYVGFHILAFVFLLPWILKTIKYQAYVRDSGVSLSWWGFFTAASAFNDLGYTLTPDSMLSFRDSAYALLVMSFFIIVGNTGFPIVLRFFIWIMFKCSRELSLFQESLGFLLDHPRRCFTLLFPSAPTWWLFFILLLMNAVDLILFIILDLNAPVVEDLSAGHKVLDGFFQAVSTRTAGFACVDLSQLHPAVQVSYMVMMYISVMPLAISIRRTNVYEEQSLGVYMGKNGEEEADDKQKPASFIGAHLRKQLSFDLWFVFLGLFIICIAEGDRIKDTTEPSFNVFQCMFEVVSAYGTVGMSLGYPNTSPSFSGEFNVVSKLVIIAMMIRGRHRGLPYSLDRAIMLPSAKMDKRDKYQDLHAGHHLNRAETIGSIDDPVFEFFKSAAPKVIRNRMKRPSFFSAKSDNVSTTRSHRRTQSNISNSSVGGPSNAGINARASVDTEQTADYFSHRPRASQDYRFRDVHFSHTSLDNGLCDITSRDENIAPTESYEMAHMGGYIGGGPVRTAETDVIHEAVDLGTRRNSLQTL